MIPSHASDVSQSATSPACQIGGMEPITLESCHSIWIIDTERMRFRRVLKDLEVGHRSVSTAWRPYARFQFEPHGEAFTIVLTPDGSRRIRSWRHTVDCTQCGGHATTELSLTDLLEAVNH
jgi:hypothetical protein